MLFLSITGFDADPDLVTQTLGITPTWTARKGDLLINGRHRQVNQWRLEERSTVLSSGADHEDALVSLTTLLHAREARFR